MRYILAVADAGTVSGAARTLGVNHATVLRRVAAFEEAHGGAVFERGPLGYTLMPERAAVIEAARGAAQAMAAVDALMAGRGAGGPHLVRVTSVDTLCQTVLSKVPGGGLTLLSSNARLDLARLQADVAVRPTQSLPEGMAGNPAAELGFAVYQRRGASVTGWLGLAGILSQARPAAWLATEVAPSRIVSAADSFLVLRAMALQGLGRTILPRILGDAEPGLALIEGAMPRIRVPIWVCASHDVAESRRIQKVMQRLTSHLGSMADHLIGA